LPSVSAHFKERRTKAILVKEYFCPALLQKIIIKIRLKLLETKFWEELMAYFPLIQHGPYRKQRLQQFFVAVGTPSPSCYIATIMGYTDPQTLF
jgi:hypothetical protein